LQVTETRNAKRAGSIRRLPRALTPEDRRWLLAQPNPRWPTGCRNRALLGVMIYGGLRCAEALALRPRDVDLASADPQIRVVKGKGGKDRNIPVMRDLEPLLLEWRARRPPGRTFFTTRDGKPIDTRYARRMVSRYAAKAGIDERVHPHMLRVTAATIWHNEKGCSSREVQQLLGHERLATTELYLSASPAAIGRKLRGAA
jgi:site-specific recombinase XerD